MPTLYEILEVDSNASQADIKKAYRKLSIKYHPDRKTGNESQFKAINEAYTLLSNERVRNHYHDMLNTQSPKSALEEAQELHNKIEKGEIKARQDEADHEAEQQEMPRHETEKQDVDTAKPQSQNAGSEAKRENGDPPKQQTFRKFFKGFNDRYSTGNKASFFKRHVDVNRGYTYGRPLESTQALIISAAMLALKYADHLQMQQSGRSNPLLQDRLMNVLMITYFLIDSNSKLNIKFSQKFDLDETIKQPTRPMR